MNEIKWKPRVFWQRILTMAKKKTLCEKEHFLIIISMSFSHNVCFLYPVVVRWILEDKFNIYFYCHHVTFQFLQPITKGLQFRKSCSLYNHSIMNNEHSSPFPLSKVSHSSNSKQLKFENLDKCKVILGIMCIYQ